MNWLVGNGVIAEDTSENKLRPESMSELIREVQSSLLNLIGQGVGIVPGFIAAIVILVLTRYGVNLVQTLAITAGERTIRSTSLRALLVQTSSVATWVVGILAASVFAFPDLRLGDIVGLLGLGSVAVGFAFQDIFKNFFAGVLILANEPFRLNDQIIVSDFEGTVEEIDIRVTKIRTYQGERVVVPNAVVFTSPIQVLTAFPYRRTDLPIGVDYNTPLPSAIQTLLATLKDIDGVLSTPAAEVDIDSFGENSIDLLVRYWTLPQIIHVRQTKTRVILALKQACNQANIDISYPTRVLYFYDQQQFNERIPTSANGDLS